LQGVSLVQRTSAENAAKAIDYFQQAIAKDPKFAKAYAMIGEAQMGWANLGAPFEHRVAAERAARQALALDQNLANAHNVLAGISVARGQALDMEAHGRAAVALADNDGFTHTIRAVNLHYTGH
jgi:serine/threonine-protein kinase